MWLKEPGAALRALTVLGEQPDVEVSVAEIDKDGVRLLASTWVSSSAEREKHAAGLRAACLERLDREGLSSEGGS